MKIALVSTPFFGVPAPKYGGLERVVWDLGNGLIKIGHKVAVFAPEGSRVPDGGFWFNTGPSHDTVNVDWLKLEGDMTSSIAPYFDRFDVVHENNWFFSSYRHNHKHNICHTHHGGLNVDYISVSKANKNNLIAISQYMKGYYNSLGFNSEYAYNPVDLSEYKFKKEKGDRLLFVGRLDTFKRPETAIRVARKLGMSIDIVGGSFVQDPMYLQTIKDFCNEPSNKATLHLDATQGEKIELYQNAKAVIFPSRMGEPFGLIVPEANACGTPVVGTNDGAIQETIIDGINGFHVGKQTSQHNPIQDDVDAIADAVKIVDGISPEACRKRAEFFSLENCAKRYVELYQRVVIGDHW